jgi:hypothetical protein
LDYAVFLEFGRLEGFDAGSTIQWIHLVRSVHSAR